MQRRLNLSLLELQFSFSEWLTDNSWKENDVFRAAKQKLQMNFAIFSVFKVLYRRKSTYKTAKYREST